MNLTIATVRAFYRDDEALLAIGAVLAARLLASEAREAVDAYIEPLLADFDFRVDNECDRGSPRDGTPITKSSDLLLTDQDCAAYYAACDAAHAEHGHDLEPGYCPALIAESAVIDAENALIKLASDRYGVDFTRLYKLESRAALLKLLTEGCAR